MLCLHLKASVHTLPAVIKGAHNGHFIYVRVGGGGTGGIVVGETWVNNSELICRHCATHYCCSLSVKH